MIVVVTMQHLGTRPESPGSPHLSDLLGLWPISPPPPPPPIPPPLSPGGQLLCQISGWMNLKTRLTHARKSIVLQFTWKARRKALRAHKCQSYQIYRAVPQALCEVSILQAERTWQNAAQSDSVSFTGATREHLPCKALYVAPHAMNTAHEGDNWLK